MSSFLEEWQSHLRKIAPEEVLVEDTPPNNGSGDAHCPAKKIVDRVDPAARRVYNNAYRTRNKDRLNAVRKRYDTTPKGAYNKARHRAIAKKQEWDISFKNWWQVWNACPKIYDDTMAQYRTAWEMRGSNINENTQMRRRDLGKGWIVSNVEIIYRNQPIPEHGIVAPWDWDRGCPFTLEKLI